MPNAEAVFLVNFSIYLFLQAQRKGQPSLLAIGLKQELGEKCTNLPGTNLQSHSWGRAVFNQRVPLDRGCESAPQRELEASPLQRSASPGPARGSAL